MEGKNVKKSILFALILAVSTYSWQQMATACPKDGHGCQKNQSGQQLGEESGQQPADRQEATGKPDCDHPCNGQNKDGEPCTKKPLCDRKL